jgi:hypothetical protein
VSGPGDRWKLDVRPRAQRQLARLPEKIAAAAAEFITGPLLDSPRRVGHPLRDEYATADADSSSQSQLPSLALLITEVSYVPCALDQSDSQTWSSA